MQPCSDLNKTGALAEATDSSSNGSNSSECNSGKKKKRARDSNASPITVVITDIYNFRAKVQKFTGMATSPASSTSEESEKKSPLVFKPKARRGAVNVPPSTFPFLSSVLTNSTNSCNLPLTDCLLKLPLMEADAQKSNSLLHPAFRNNKASNHKSSYSVSLLFEELWEELERTENAAICN